MARHGYGPAIWIATVVNPKTRRPYDILFRAENVLDVRVPVDGKKVAEGFFDFEAPSSCLRSHTMPGVRSERRGEGLGFVLYAGLALVAGWRAALSPRQRRGASMGWLVEQATGPCVASPSGTSGRTEAADAWWQAQVARGFASAFVANGALWNVLAAENVLDSGLVLAANRILAAWHPPRLMSPRLQQQLDLSEVRDRGGILPLRLAAHAPRRAKAKASNPSDWGRAFGGFVFHDFHEKPGWIPGGSL